MTHRVSCKNDHLCSRCRQRIETQPHHPEIGPLGSQCIPLRAFQASPGDSQSRWIVAAEQEGDKCSHTGSHRGLRKEVKIEMTGWKTCRVTQMGKRSDQTGSWRDGTAQSGWIASNCHLWCFSRSAWLSEIVKPAILEFFLSLSLASVIGRNPWIFKSKTSFYILSLQR